MSGSSEVTGEAWKEPGRKCLELLSSLFRAPAALDIDGKHQAGVDGEQLQVEDTHYSTRLTTVLLAWLEKRTEERPSPTITADAWWKR